MVCNFILLLLITEKAEAIIPALTNTQIYTLCTQHAETKSAPATAECQQMSCQLAQQTATKINNN